MTFEQLRKALAQRDRVRIPGPEAGWRQPTFGCIVDGPELVSTLQGEDFYYWIEFDTPQHDLSGDGPYRRAQILSRYLEPTGPNS